MESLPGRALSYEPCVVEFSFYTVQTNYDAIILQVLMYDFTTAFLFLLVRNDALYGLPW
jgi:hypothetical protein